LSASQPFIPVAEPLLGDKELAYVTDCVKSGWVSSLGKYVRDFESRFAAYCGVKYGVATFNGTVALHLLAVTLNLGPGDEVIMPSLTFVATANAIRYTGATPVFVDSERETWNLDPSQVEAAITPRTKAIIAVHLYGHRPIWTRYERLPSGTTCGCSKTPLRRMGHCTKGVRWAA
jgi:perosamine synthetase